MNKSAIDYRLTGHTGQEAPRVRGVGAGGPPGPEGQMREEREEGPVLRSGRRPFHRNVADLVGSSILAFTRITRRSDLRWPERRLAGPDGWICVGSWNLMGGLGIQGGEIGASGKPGWKYILHTAAVKVRSLP